jgi:hypothetical protein
MMICGIRFNLYLSFLLALGIATGCKSAEGKEKKLLSTLKLHQEINPDPIGRSESVEVYRESPVHFTVDKVPFLTEASVKEAKVIEVTGGFALQLQFDRQGSWLLEQYTAKPSKHILVFSQFVSPGEEKINSGRWLAAPMVRTHITDGLFIFAPDATRQEAQQIALGLNNVAKKLATGEELK